MFAIVRVVCIGPSWTVFTPAQRSCIVSGEVLSMSVNQYRLFARTRLLLLPVVRSKYISQVLDNSSRDSKQGDAVANWRKAISTFIRASGRVNAPHQTFLVMEFLHAVLMLRASVIAYNLEIDANQWFCKTTRSTICTYVHCVPSAWWGY